METVYIETTVVGNIAGRLHPDPAVSIRQQLTRDWWANAPNLYKLLVSQLTIDECGDGDPVAAEERLKILQGIALLDESKSAENLADLLLDRLAVPSLSLAMLCISPLQPCMVYNT